MIKVSFLVSLFFLSLASYSQNGKRWIFGDGVDLEFTDTGIVQRPSNFYSYESSATCTLDIDYFSSNGEILYLNNDSIKALLGNSSSAQGTIFLESSSDSIVSFIISNDMFDQNLNHYIVRYNKISSSLTSKIIMKNGREQLAAVNHRNNKSEWIFFHQGGSSNYFSFLYNNNKLLCCPKKIKRGFDYSNSPYPWGAGSIIKFSSDGTLIGNARNNELEIFIFNNENGNFGDSVLIEGFTIYNFCFSKSAKYVYPVSNQLWQVPLENIIDNGINVGVARRIAPANTSWDNSYGQIGLGYNDKIYLSMIDSFHLGVIENPEESYSNLIFNRKGLPLTYGKSERGLPNFNASYFYTPSIDFAYTEDCWEHSYSFEGRDTLEATNWKWIFRDVRNETVDVILGKNVSYTFPQADSLENKYEVTHIASTASRSDTVTKTLTIRPKWEADMLGRDTFYCARSPFDSAQDDFTLTLRAPADMHCVHWGDKGPIEEPNLDESLGLIVDYDHFHTDTLAVDTAGTYIVKVTNKTFCQMWDTITISEYPIPDKSLISRFKDSIVSNTLSHSYRWYRNGEAKFETSVRRLDPDSNGYWQVQLVSEFGCESELSDSLNVGFATLDHRYETLDFRLYPNPSNGHILLQVPKEGEYKIQVTDLNGKLIYSTTQNLSPRMSLFAAANITAGTYILTLTDQDGNTGSKKIEVVK